MKVLLFEDPITDKNDLCWRMGHIALDVAMYHRLREIGCDCRMLTNEFGESNALQGAVAQDNLFIVPEHELINQLPDSQERIHHLFHNKEHYLSPNHPDSKKSWFPNWRGLFPKDRELYQAECATNKYRELVLRRLSRVFARHLGEFVPDLIISWFPIPYIRRLFPKCQVLYKEAGFFGVAPFPWSHYTDPLGFHSHSWIRRYPEMALAPEGIPALQELRRLFIPRINAASPFTSIVRKLRRDYRKCILVALQSNNYYLFDKSCGYRSQAHVLLDVLAQVPTDFAVIPTLHPSHGTLTPVERTFIKDRYPNCIFIAESEQFHAPSQYLIPDCDAVITLGSAVGWHALFHQKPLVVLSDCHLNPSADFETVPSLVDHLNDPRSGPDNDAHLAWIMFHYSIPRLIYDQPELSSRYLRRLLESIQGDPVHFYRDPVLPYDEYVAEIKRMAQWSIPVPKAAA